MNNFFHYDMNEKEFRAACKQACEKFLRLPAIKIIDAVGVYDSVFGGSGLDSNRLTKGLIYLAKSGCLIDPGFEVRKYNFLDKVDYLSTTPMPADMTFISYILAEKPLGRAFVGHAYIPEKMDNLKSEFLKSSDIKLLDRNLGGIFSQHHSDIAWRDRVRKSGVKIIYTHGGQHEIGTNMFKDFYDVVIPTPQKDKMADDDSDLVSGLYGKEMDVPLPWTGFAADRDYLQSILPALSASATSFAMGASKLAQTNVIPIMEREFRAA